MHVLVDAIRPRITHHCELQFVICLISFNMPTSGENQHIALNYTRLKLQHLEIKNHDQNTYENERSVSEVASDNDKRQACHGEMYEVEVAPVQGAYNVINPGNTIEVAPAQGAYNLTNQDAPNYELYNVINVPTLSRTCITIHARCCVIIIVAVIVLTIFSVMTGTLTYLILNLGKFFTRFIFIIRLFGFFRLCLIILCI